MKRVRPGPKPLMHSDQVLVWDLSHLAASEGPDPTPLSVNGDVSREGRETRPPLPPRAEKGAAPPGGPPPPPATPPSTPRRPVRRCRASWRAALPSALRPPCKRPLGT